MLSHLAPLRPQLRALPALLASCLALPVLAQIPPDAGAVQRETERALRPMPAAPAPAVPAKPLTDEARGARVTVREFIIEGASLRPAEELKALMSDLVGRSLALAELDQAAQRIVRHYRENGWWARAYLPEQDATDGRIRIQVVEGRYGGSRLEQRGTTRADAGFVERTVVSRLVEGEPLSADAVERGLLLANDLAGIRATGVLGPGDRPGHSRLRLRVEDTSLLSGNAGLDNGGIKATGTLRAFGGIALNNLGGRGDRLSLQALAAARLASGRIAWQTPLGSDGWSFAAHVSHLRYRLGERFRALDGKGRATTAGGEIRYALLRQADRNLNLFAGYEQRRYTDELLGATSRRHKVTAFGLGLRGDQRDSLGGGGVTWGELRLVEGRLRIGDVAGDKALDAAGPRAAGGYGKLAGEISRLQALGAGFRLSAALSGQWARKNLGASEQFVLGGPNGVRAYPVNEAAGDEGLLLQLALQRPFGNGWLAQGFIDSGRIRQHKNTWAGWRGGARAPNSYGLSGIGIGLAHEGGDGWGRWRLAASLATPIGHNPGRDARGRNNDGSRASATRLWLTASAAF